MNLLNYTLKMIICRRCRITRRSAANVSNKKCLRCQAQHKTVMHEHNFKMLENYVIFFFIWKNIFDVINV